MDADFIIWWKFQVKEKDAPLGGKKSEIKPSCGHFSVLKTPFDQAGEGRQVCDICAK